MNPIMAVGLGAQFLGGIFGGKKKNKAAKALKADINKIMDRAYNQTVEDDATNVARVRADEARLAAATGIDFQKLRDDALKAGFNPLTALQATGAAGYDGRGAVLTTPFLNRADVTSRKAELFAGGVGQGVVESSGYFGDALKGLGDGLFGAGQADVSMAHDMAMLRASMTGASTVAPQRKGGSAPLQAAIRKLTTSPVYNRGGQEIFGPANPFEKIWVYEPAGIPLQIEKSWAERNGFKEGDQFSAGDFEVWLGESGQAASAVTSAPSYLQMLLRPFQAPVPGRQPVVRPPIFPVQKAPVKAPPVRLRGGFVRP